MAILVFAHVEMTTSIEKIKGRIPDAHASDSCHIEDEPTNFKIKLIDRLSFGWETVQNHVVVVRDNF